MKTQFRAHTVGALVFLGFASMVPLAQAGAPNRCDETSRDIREAVSKDPSKVLMIVEDALVINESCACEIVKAAIQSSNADEALVKQIVQTALAVAPNMSAIIAECAAAVAPGSGDAVAVLEGGKGQSAKEPSPAVVPVAPVAPKTKGTDFGNAGATNIRGVYLTQPAAAGFLVSQTDDEEVTHDEKCCGGDTDDDDDDATDRANSRRTRNLVAVSPAQARP